MKQPDVLQFLQETEVLFTAPSNTEDRKRVIFEYSCKDRRKSTADRDLVGGGFTA